MSKNDELILCFEKSLLDSVNKENMTSYMLQEILRTPGVMQYKRRGDVETDTSLLQPIPYCIVFCRSTERILSYKRSKKGGETRLHDRYSIGFGGHVNIDDVKHCLKELDEAALITAEYPILFGARRELKEELSLTEENTVALRLFDDWYIYDDTSEVSSVHIGLPYLCVVENESDIKLAEDTVIELRWIDVDDPKDTALQFESWSSIALAKLIQTSNGGRKAKAREMLMNKYGMDEETALHCVQNILAILEPNVRI